jgi:hypothetical protein
MKGEMWMDEQTGEVTRARMLDPTGTLLDEISDRTLHQLDVAQTMALVRQWGQEQEVDWGAVSSAAVIRWSRPGWRRIKTLAWTGRCWPEEEAG